MRTLEDFFFFFFNRDLEGWKLTAKSPLVYGISKDSFRNSRHFSLRLSKAFLRDSFANGRDISEDSLWFRRDL